MIIKTKRYKLENKTYINLAMRHLLRTQWRWAAVPVGILLLNLVLNLTGVYANWWIYLVALLVVVGYLLFWFIQFTGVTQLEQSKPMFQKFIYEIDSRQILMKLNTKEGMQLKWENIKGAVKEKEHFLLFFSRVQFLHLPFTIFNSENDIRFLESILKRKNLLK
ncbi:MAG: YcxB family protein [Ferruginibacter sp.]|nr:YcxB family protein [Cytophagales bacterium]